MATFPGGSAYAMAHDIGDGYIAVTERTYLRFDPAQLDLLAFELDRFLREARSGQTALDDLTAIQQRNRKMQRLTGALSMLRAFQARRRPGGLAASGAGPTRR